MKQLLTLCLLTFQWLLIPASLLADVDPTPYPASLLESVLGQYINCSWENEGMAYLFTGTPYDGEIFAVRCNGENTFFTVMTVVDGRVCSMLESDTAIFQEPVTELYMEVDNEISVFFESGSSMLYEKGADHEWSLAHYSECNEDHSFSVSMINNLVTAYEYEDLETGICEKDSLCGLRLFDTDFSSVDIENLPDSIDSLRSLITTSSSSESYIMDTMVVEDCCYYASCVLHGQTAALCVYADGEITRFHEDQLLRITGFHVYIDGMYCATVDREYNMIYDQYYGDSMISLSISNDSKEITIIPCWDDGSSDLSYSFAFLIQ